MKEKYGRAINVELIAGSGGIFEVSLDEEKIFSKKRLGRFPNAGEIVLLLEAAR